MKGNPREASLFYRGPVSVRVQYEYINVCILLTTNSETAMICKKFSNVYRSRQAGEFYSVQHLVTNKVSSSPLKKSGKLLLEAQWGSEASRACTEDRQSHKFGIEAGHDGQGPGAAVHRCSCLVHWQKGRHFIPTWKDNDILEAINKSLCLTDSLYSDKYESVSFVKPVLHLFKSSILKVKCDVQDFTYTIKTKVLSYLSEKFTRNGHFKHKNTIW